MIYREFPDLFGRLLRRFSAVLLIVFTHLPLSFSYAQIIEVTPCSAAPTALHFAEKLRELPALAPAECEALSKDEYKSVAQELILQDVNVGAFQWEGELLKRLGFIPYAYDYSGCLIEGYSTLAAAFYSPTKKKFILPAWSETPLVILIHEAVHVLQDQHYHTDKIKTSKFLFSDEVLALSSVLEGDAMLVETKYAQQRTTNEPLDPLEEARIYTKCELPPLLQQLSNAIYQYGEVFVHYVEERGGSAAVETLFKDLPRTTSAVLHPKRFFGRRETPRAVRVFAPAIVRERGCRQRFSDSLGELDLRVLLASTNSPKQSVVGAAEWNGDRVAVFECGSEMIVTLRVVVRDGSKGELCAALGRHLVAVKGREAGKLKYSLSCSEQEILVELR